MYRSTFLNRLLSSLAACISLAACRDAATSPQHEPVPQFRNLGTVIVDVDLERGVVTVHPLDANPSVARGVSAHFYGTTSQILHSLTSLTKTPIGADGAEYHLQDRLTNLLGFAIGTNSPHTAPAFPQDTMGVFVYYSLPPYNFTSSGAPCPACTVSIDSADGAYPFTTVAAQPYVFFKTILEGNGPSDPLSTTNQSASGGIDYFRTLHFRTSGSVTNFTFGLSVSAAWVDQNDSRWKVAYVADSVPTRSSLQHLISEPDWRRLGSTGAITITPAACVPGSCLLTLVSTTTATGEDTLVFYRSDSLRASQSGYIAATLNLSTLTGAQPGVFLGLQDPARLAQVGISTLLTGFCDSTGTLLPEFSVATVLGRTTYRVAKYGTDSASIFSPAGSSVALVTIPYVSLPIAPPRQPGATGYDRFFFFGNLTRTVAATAATSLWANVSYEIGVSAP
jgi:hypothetical protein